MMRKNTEPYFYTVQTKHININIINMTSFAYQSAR